MMDQDPPGSDPGPESTGPRSPRSAPLVPEIVEHGPSDDSPGWESGPPYGERGRSALFGPQAFGGGRVRVYGCSPGCLLISVAVSIIVSILLTLLLNAII